VLTRTELNRAIPMCRTPSRGISRFFGMGLTTPEVASISGHKDFRVLMRYAPFDEALSSRWTRLSQNLLCHH
jgi:hypothetical protein